MTKLSLIMGLPGSGKTSYAKKIRGKKIHVDEVRKTLTNNYKPDIHEELVYEVVEKTVRYYLNNKMDVVVDAAFLSRISRKRIIDIGVDYASEITIYWLDTSKKLIQERLNERNKNVSDDRKISIEYVEKLEKKLEMPSDNEGIDELHYLSDIDFKN